MAIVFWLSFFTGIQLEVFVSLFVFAYFAVSTIYKPRRRAYDILGLGLLISFCFIVVFKVLGILFH